MAFVSLRGGNPTWVDCRGSTSPFSSVIDEKFASLAWMREEGESEGREFYSLPLSSVVVVKSVGIVEHVN